MQFQILKNSLLPCLVSVCVFSATYGQSGPVANSADSEINGIRQTLIDYIEGSTNGQPDRLRKAFHPKLNLYSIRNNKLSIWAGTAYIADTKQGVPTGERGTILSIDYENNTAVAKVKIAPARGTPFVDYFMLLKIDGNWTIVHKMYTRQNGSSGTWTSESAQSNPESGQPSKKNNSTKQKENQNKVSVGVREKIDSLFSEYDNLDSPGVAVSVVRKGQPVFQNAYGAANLEHRIPVDLQKTLFNVGSVSKQFTAFAIALLVDDGKLSFDDDIRKFLPELPDLGHKISLKHLLNHTSGIRSELGLLALAGWSPGDVIRPRHILHIVNCQQGLNFDPGEDFEYCNSGYTLLAEVVSRVTDQPFHQFCRERILQPLGMNTAAFSEGQAQLRKNMAYSYSIDSEGAFPRFPNDEYSGSTGLWTTCEDLARWAANFHSHQVGSQKVWEQMQDSGILNDGSATGYGLGLMIEDYRGRKHVQHGGGTAGYVSYVGHFPDENLSIVLTGNSNGISVRDMALQVADVLLDDAGNDLSDAKQTAEAMELSNEKLDQFVGRYWNLKEKSVAIVRQENSLTYAIDGGPNISLEPINEFEFRMLNVGVNSKVVFKPFKQPSSDTGQFSIHVIQDRGEVDRLEPYQSPSLSIDDLRPFVGRYHSSELDTDYTVELVNNQIVVNHLRFRGVGLTPINGTTFHSSGWRFTTLHFERNETQVTGFRLHSLRNRNLKFERLD